MVRGVASDWNAESYHRVSEPQRAWGEQVLASLELAGDETVIDAGCGTGRLTARLAERLSAGRVIALDASPAMLEIAQETLAPFGDRIRFVQATLARDPLPLGADVLFSTATFHWVRNHDALFRSIAAALVPGGRLHAQCGGAGNLDRAHARTQEVAQLARYAQYFAEMTPAWEFATREKTEQRLAAAGFVELEVALRAAPTPFPDARSFSEFVATVVLRPFLARLPEELRPAFVADVTARAERDDPPLTLDYVRLDLRARRGC
jgi:trans-aconitate 2-methyltransferase